ncbi:hypothetical protein JX580_05085 [Thiomicrospira microaerophila]|uniref:hypothetical protein n=1 Tax=Thiomicrospira microaerophila TaxID=406020 RepID=UPI00200D6E24|nr:hypothetical protein [Thiomicrospira microaerophila]UQB43251.1 hypothetical protein JX580_05085 [Thiomicrospira microaerophila]
MATTKNILVWQSSAVECEQLAALTYNKINIMLIEHDHDFIAHAEPNTLWVTPTLTTEQWKALSSSLSDHPDAMLHLIYEQPTMALAAEIESAQNLKQAQTLWLQHTKQLIQFFKQHRKQCRLINAAVLYNQQEPFFDYLTENLISLSGAEQLCSMPDFAENHAARISYIIANQLLTQTHQSIKILQELEACTHLSAQPEQNLTALQKVFSQVISLFSQQQTDTQARHQAEQIAQQTQQQVKDLSAQKQTLENKLTSSEQENTLLIEQLHQVQEQLEQTYQQANQDKNAILKHEKEAAYQQNTLKQLTEKLAQTEKAHHQQTEQQTQARHQAEQIAQQTQQQVKDLSAQKQTLENKLTSSEQENELIIEQLHLVQEQLEIQIHQNQGLQIEQQQQQSLNSSLNQTIEQQESRINWLIRQANKNAKQLHKASWSHRRRLNKSAAQIKATDLFDANWYLAQYPDIAKTTLDPALHYLIYGANEGRNPSAKFNTLDYLTEYADVALDGANPLIHFIKFGQYEGRKPDPLQKRLPAPNNV